MTSSSAQPIEAVLDELAIALAGARRTLLIGGYGCGNTGDEAILSVLVDDARALGIETAVVSASPAETRAMHGVHAISATPAAIAAELLRSDALIIGGGGIFSGYMGARSKLHPALAAAATLAGKKLIFRALGVYTSTPPLVGRALAFAMRHADFVSVRDEASIAALRGFRLRREIILEDDPGLRLRPRPARVTPPPGAVGIAVRRVRDARLQPAIEGELVRLLDALTAAGRTPVLIPFCEHPSEPVEQDGGYAARLMARSTARDRCVLLDPGIPPAELLDIIGRLDALVAMRFHAIVFGHLAGVPMLALPYDDKCASFAAARDITTLSLADATAEAMLAAIGGGRRLEMSA
jgi:polysaccharide pyruvyl transferase WcaK-like protein